MPRKVTTWRPTTASASSSVPVSGSLLAPRRASAAWGGPGGCAVVPGSAGTGGGTGDFRGSWLSVIRMPCGPPMVTTVSLPLEVTRTRSCFRRSKSPMMLPAIRMTRNRTISRHHDREEAHCETWLLTRTSQAIQAGRVRAARLRRRLPQARGERQGRQNQHQVHGHGRERHRPEITQRAPELRHESSSPGHQGRSGKDFRDGWAPLHAPCDGPRPGATDCNPPGCTAGRPGPAPTQAGTQSA